jgi:hypothetical protein
VHVMVRRPWTLTCARPFGRRHTPDEGPDGEQTKR